MKEDTNYRNMELFFSSILEGMQDSIIVLNRNFEILYANSSYSRNVGCRLEQIKGRYCYEISHRRKKPCYQEDKECVVKRTFDTGFSSSMIYMHPDMTNNPQYFETIAYPIKDISGYIVSVAKRITDITEKNKLNHELKTRVKDLEEFYNMAVGREVKMIELKEEIKNLRNELARYKNESRQ